MGQKHSRPRPGENGQDSLLQGEQQQNNSNQQQNASSQQQPQQAAGGYAPSPVYQQVRGVCSSCNPAAVRQSLRVCSQLHIFVSCCCAAVPWGLHQRPVLWGLRSRNICRSPDVWHLQRMHVQQTRRIFACWTQHIQQWTQHIQQWLAQPCSSAQAGSVLVARQCGGVTRGAFACSAWLFQPLHVGAAPCHHHKQTGLAKASSRPNYQTKYVCGVVLCRAVAPLLVLTCTSQGRMVMHPGHTCPHRRSSRRRKSKTKST